MSRWQPPAWATEPTPALVVLQYRGDTLLQKLALKPCLILGRQPGVCDLVVEGDESVSRQHGALVGGREGIWLFDLKSTKGVFFKHTGEPRFVKVAVEAPAKLTEGSSFTLGEPSSSFRYVLKAAAPPKAPLPSALAGAAIASAVPTVAFTSLTNPPPSAAASSDVRWQPPAWAVEPLAAVEAALQRGSQVIQTLDLSRKRAYVIGREHQMADLVLSHDSVSRQHAALLHSTQGAGGAHSLHVIDLNSTKGTYIDTGSGWSRLAQSVAAVLPRGGRVRLGECSTLLVFPHEGVAPAPPVTERERADDIPRFSSLVQSKVIVSNGAGSAKTDGEGGGGGKIEGGGAGSQEGGEGGESRSAPARLPGVDEQPSSWESLAAAHARAVDEGESDEEAAAPAKTSNADFRSMLAPFLKRRVEEMDTGMPRGRKQKQNKRQADRHSDESDDEVVPPLSLGKFETSDPMGGGFVLRKTKTAVKKSGGGKSKEERIKF